MPYCDFLPNTYPGAELRHIEERGYQHIDATAFVWRDWERIRGESFTRILCSVDLQSRCCTDGRLGRGYRGFPLLAPVLSLATDVFFEDLTATLVSDLPSRFHIICTFEGQDRIDAVIDQRYAQWRAAMAMQGSGSWQPAGIGLANASAPCVSATGGKIASISDLKFVSV